MPRRPFALCIALVATLGACKDSTSVTVGTARLRIINSVFQGDSAPSSVPIAVDVLIDSSMSGAGLSDLTGPALSPGSASGEGAGAHSGAGAIFTAAGYRDLASGVHNFAARVTGGTDSTADLLRNGGAPANLKQFLYPYPYTFVLAGVIPPNGTAPPDDAVPWTMFSDDPFTPPADSVGGGLTARLQVINAAPMADPSGQGADITATFINGADTITTTASYRGSSGFINPPAGTYVVVFSTASDTLRTDTLTFAKGEVRTLILQSTAYAATPGPGNTKLTNLLDNQW